jgi:hypothetical protein
LLGAGANLAGRQSDTALGEQLLGLVFVEVQRNFRFEFENQRWSTGTTLSPTGPV